MRPSWPPPRMPMTPPGAMTWFCSADFAAGFIGSSMRSRRRLGVRRMMRDFGGLPLAIGGALGRELRIGEGEDRGCEQAGIDRARPADRQGTDRNAGGHLHDR